MFDIICGLCFYYWVGRLIFGSTRSNEDEYMG